MIVSCKCGYSAKVADGSVGRSVRCPKCRSVVQIAGGEGTVSQRALFDCCQCGYRKEMPGKYVGRKALCPKCKTKGRVGLLDDSQPSGAEKGRPASSLSHKVQSAKNLFSPTKALTLILFALLVALPVLYFTNDRFATMVAVAFPPEIEYRPLPLDSLHNQSPEYTRLVEIARILQSSRNLRGMDLSGIDLCQVVNSSHCFPEHFHDDCYLIGLIESGNCHCLGTRQKDAIAGPGSVTLLNPGQIHSCIPINKAGLNYTMCYISLEAMGSLARDLGLYRNATPEFTAAILEEPLITAMFRNLFRTLIHSRDRLEKEALLVSVFHFVLSRHGLKDRTKQDRMLRHQPMSLARELLSQELDQKLTLEKVAQSVGLSRFHFQRTFKRETGLSPHLYRTLKRVEAARELLLETNAYFTFLVN